VDHWSEGLNYSMATISKKLTKILLIIVAFTVPSFSFAMIQQNVFDSMSEQPLTSSSTILTYMSQSQLNVFKALMATVLWASLLLMMFFKTLNLIRS